MLKKSRSLVALMVGSAACFSPAVALAMQQQRQSYDQPAQDLGDALRSAATIADIELYASSRDLEGKTAPPLKGELTSREAIEVLLKGSRLIARFEVGSVIISRLTSTADSTATDAEPIVVTGSRITGAPTAIPVIRVTLEDIRNSGHADLGEVARSLPQNFGGGQNPGIGNSQGAANENVNANGASTFNLRGIGPNATLTLINGNRFAYSSVNSVIDVSAIPIAAVDRVEIVADGASAIYGADAVAGVVNILLKRDYEGVSTSARLGLSTDGGNFQQQYNLLGGSRWSDGGIIAAYDYSHGTAIRAKDRSYASANNPDSTLFPNLRRHAVLLSGHQSLGGGVTLAADLIYKRGRMESATGFTVAQPLRNSGLEARTKFETFGVAPTLSAELSANWKLKAGAFFGTDTTDGLSQNFSGGAPSTATARHFFNRNIAVEAGLEGSLFELPAGAARLAFGGGYRTNRFKSEIGTRSFSRSRRNHFAYGELLLPIANPDQDLAFAHRASLTGALRYEDYSDSGDIVTPKLSFIYDPVEQVRLGVSWGKSFKLPTLYQQYSGYVALLVPVGGFGQGFPAGSTVAYALGPNDRLEPERSENWTFSATVKPLDGLEVSASYFRIDYTDRVAPPLASGAGVLNNPIFADLVTLNPGPGLLDVIFAGADGGLQNITGSPYDPARVVAFLDARDRNIARQKYRGFDIAVRYDVELGSDRRLSLNAGATWLDSSQQLLAGLPVTDLAGTIFRPPHLRARGGLTLSDKAFSLAAFLNHSASVTDNRRPAAVKLGGSTTLDLTGRLRLGAGTEVALSAQNVFNSKPEPIFTTSPFDAPFDTTNGSAIGRFLSVTVRHDW